MIDPAAIMVIVGAALQAVPPGHAFITLISRRPNAAALSAGRRS
jgi:hypothetical protein